MNYIEPANIPSERFVSALSRYRNMQVIYYHMSNKKVLSFPTYRKQVSATPGPNDSYMVVPSGMEYRPDLVSYEVYGTPDFWWKIMEANNIKDIFDFKTGTNLRIPNNIF